MSNSIKNLLLIHSPLVGPYSWQPAAEQLERAGHNVWVPSLLPILDKSANFAEAIAHCIAKTAETHSLPDNIILVAHSAAGAYLPIIAAALSQHISAYIFVDARLPQNGASLADQDSAQFEEERQRLAVNGLLPPWSEWFGQGVMDQILPDKTQRKAFTAELRPIPLALFHEKITYSASWPDAPCAYLRFSEFYKPLADEARKEGWLVESIQAEHLYPVTHPRQTASMIVQLIHDLLQV
jgi:hypothetical protein